jgi:hypothetical protein
LSRSILYYNTFLTRNGVKTSVPVESLIDAIFLPMNDVEKFWDRKKLSLLYLGLIEAEHPVKRYNRSFAIAKYRDSYKPYLGRIGTNQAIPIEEDVIEFTNCYLIGHSRQIAIEYNHNGCRPYDIAEYFSSFLPKEPQNFWSVTLEPIETPVVINDIRNSEKIYSIEFSIDCARNLGPDFETESFFGSFLERTVDSHQQFGANVATIRFGNGRRRIDLIEAQRLVRLLTHLNLEDEIFASVKVVYDSPASGRKEKVDLKNQNILKSIIMERDNATGYEHILTEIELKYETDHQPGANAYRQYIDELSHADLPTVTPHALPVAAEAGA